MDERKFTEQELERIEIENVFCLGGGELATEEWEGFRYWYEGAPEYATEYTHDFDHTYRTVLADCMFGAPDAPDGWEQVASYASSGEADCWWCGEGTGNEDQRKDCPLCEGGGYVYIGDGWAEVVFREIEPETEDEED